MPVLQLEPVGGHYDHVAKRCFEHAPDTRVSWFLTACFCYYIENESILTDELFDDCCRWLLEHYDQITHPHKNLITRDMLAAGTGYNLTRDDYPLLVQVSGLSFIKEVAVHRNGL
jgi:hypothetical protein